MSPAAIDFTTWGDQAAAIESGERGLAIAEAVGHLALQAVATVLLGFAHLGRGDFRQAIAFLRKSAGLLQKRTPPDVQSSEHHLCQALALAEELGMRPLVARCHLDLGRLYRHAGDRSKAREHLSVAAVSPRSAS